MGVFATCTGQWLCGPTMVSLTVLRSTQSQNSHGEVVLSFASHVALRFDLQPMRGGVVRMLHGRTVEVAYLGIVAGNPDIYAFDRAVHSGADIEIIDVNRYGDHTEVYWRWVR